MAQSSLLNKYMSIFLIIIFAVWKGDCDGMTHPISIVDEPITVYLTWQKSPESTMTINWITLNSPNDFLEYRQNSQQPWIRVSASQIQLPEKTPYLLHRVELTGLKNESSYEFHINNNPKLFKFQTMPAILSDRSFRFVVGGDMYHDTLEILHKTNKEAAKTSPLFVLVGGDIAYASTKLADFLPRWTHHLFDYFAGQKFERWLAWLIAWKEDMITPEGYLIPMLPAIGNHDTIGRYGQTPEQSPFFYSLFPMPGKPGYNVLDFGHYMSLIILDSGHTNPIGGVQANWLAKNLKERQDIPHKFALYHVPAYPSVHKISTEIGVEIRKYWVPSFDTYHLTAAFENHEHAYKRTYPLTANVKTVNGVVYLGDGGWGVSNPRKPRYLKDKSDYLAKTAQATHFLVVDLEKDKQTVHAINSNGLVIDSFSW